MEFKLTTQQVQKYKDWNHKCDTNTGAIDGKISFIFTPTGLGPCVVVECLCGEILNLTDCDNW